MLPFALAGVVVATWTQQVIILLGSRRGVANGVSFVLGNATFRMVLGVTALLSLRLDALALPTAKTPVIGRPYLVAVGVGLVFLGAYLFRRPPREAGGLPRWLRAIDGIKPWMSFLAGFGTVAAPGIQYVYFLGGVGALAASGLAWPAKLLALGLFTAFLELMLLTPIILFVLAGNRAEAAVRSFKRWLGRNEFRVFGAVLGVLGVFALIRAF